MALARSAAQLCAATPQMQRRSARARRARHIAADTGQTKHGAQCRRLHHVCRFSYAGTDPWEPVLQLRRSDMKRRQSKVRFALCGSGLSPDLILSKPLLGISPFTRRGRTPQRLRCSPFPFNRGNCGPATKRSVCTCAALLCAVLLAAPLLQHLVAPAEPARLPWPELNPRSQWRRRTRNCQEQPSPVRPAAMASTTEALMAAISQMVGTVGYDAVIVCTSNPAQEAYWQRRLEATRGQACPRSGAL